MMNPMKKRYNYNRLCHSHTQLGCDFNLHKLMMITIKRYDKYCCLVGLPVGHGRAEEILIIMNLEEAKSDEGYS